MWPLIQEYQSTLQTFTESHDNSGVVRSNCGDWCYRNIYIGRSVSIIYTHFTDG